MRRIKGRPRPPGVGMRVLSASGGTRSAHLLLAELKGFSGRIREIKPYQRNRRQEDEGDVDGEENRNSFPFFAFALALSSSKGQKSCS